MLAALSTVMTVVSTAYPAVQVVEFGGLPLSMYADLIQIELARPSQLDPPLNFKNVLSAPAPRSVTLLLLPNVSPPERLNVPAFKNTTW
jgi:hypothetical protein